MRTTNALGKQELHFATTFGFNNVYPELCNTDKPHLHGIQYLGLKGLLEWLELRLGIYQRDAIDSVRIALYKKAVKQAIENNSNLYYFNSFEVDGWGTAKQLLFWRDELVLSGYKFNCEDNGVVRLYALSEIEKCIEEFILGVNDRWQLVYEELQNTETLPISTIHLYEGQDTLHPFFGKLFKLIESKGVALNSIEHQYQLNGDTDLNKFKSALLQPSSKSVEAVGDGSLVILKAENDLILAKTLAKNLNADSESVLILEDKGELLERALIQNGFPALGFVRDAEDGNLDQLFKAITVFLWSPINAEKLIQFLTLSIAPLPQRLRLSLAEAFTRTVGVDNEQWNKALEKFYDNNDKAKKYKTQYDLWFNRKTASNKLGATKLEVINLYADLIQWATNYSKVMDNPSLKMSFTGFISKCKNFIEILEIEFNEDDFIKEITLNNILEEVELGQVAKPESQELGAFNHVTSSNNITNACQQIVWWHFVQKSNPFSYRVKFTETELEHLNDCNLYSIDAELEHWYSKLKNPFLHTSKQLILCIPEKVNGEIAEPNPMINDIMATFENFDKLVVDISFDGNEEIRIGDNKIELIAEEQITLPEKVKTEWEIKVDQPFTRRKLESYSSLNALINYPNEYFLNYILGIRPKDIPQTSISNLLRGNIAHRIAEVLFDIKGILELNEDDLANKISEITSQIINAEGLTFLIDKNEIALKQFRKTVQFSLSSLTRMIKSNGWEIYKQEELVRNENSKIPLTGYIDLQLKRGEELAIVDLKWGGKNSKSKSLIQEKDVQLILYDQMKRAESKKIHLSYYIINAGQMLARNKDGFSQAFEIRSDKTEVAIKDAIWQKLINTYEERWAEFNKGIIEVGDDKYDYELNSNIYQDEENYLVPSFKTKKKRVNPFSKYKSLKGRV